jgi:ribosomal protein S18 acetylase RimI-like enzyme
MKIKIEKLKSFSLETTKQINKLLKQLDSFSKPINGKELKEIAESKSNNFFVAKDEPDVIVGMIVLVVYRIPIWKKAWIEDVVVDRNYRGQGIATMLIEHAKKEAKKNGISSLNLTSRPQRVNANRLYARLGFKKRDTNVYRIEL